MSFTHHIFPLIFAEKRNMKRFPLISLVSVPLTFLADLSRYFYQDWEFAKWIGVAVVIDTLLGIAKHIIHRDASSEDFWQKFIKKIVGYMALMILSNILTNYTVGGNVVGATQWMGTYLCTFMMVREAISIMENVNAIIRIIPRSVLKRFKDFNDKGEYINHQTSDTHGTDSSSETMGT